MANLPEHRVTKDGKFFAAFTSETVAVRYALALMGTGRDGEVKLGDAVCTWPDRPMSEKSLLLMWQMGGK